MAQGVVVEVSDCSTRSNANVRLNVALLSRNARVNRLRLTSCTGTNGIIRSIYKPYRDRCV